MALFIPNNPCFRGHATVLGITTQDDWSSGYRCIERRYYETVDAQGERRLFPVHSNPPEFHEGDVVELWWTTGSNYAGFYICRAREVA